MQSIQPVFQTSSVTTAFTPVVKSNLPVSNITDLSSSIPPIQPLNQTGATNTLSTPPEVVVTYNRFAQVSGQTPETNPIQNSPESAGDAANDAVGENSATSVTVANGEEGDSTSSGNTGAETSAENVEPSRQDSPETGNRNSPDSGEFTEAELELIRELAETDREVRNHEQAHLAVGGQYTGAPEFTYERGPDGINYAVGGEVPIDVSVIPGNPEATIRKMEQVRRAANAPAEPSPQDRSVSARATQIILQARAELAEQQRAEAEEEREARQERSDNASNNRQEAINTYLELIGIGERLDEIDSPSFDLDEVV